MDWSAIFLLFHGNCAFAMYEAIASSYNQGERREGREGEESRK
jgi:hypothetical protein